jgi:hypothetical protein
LFTYQSREAGVIVRLLNMRAGFFKSIISNFTGPLLYHEKNVYKNLQIGMALKLKFPHQAPELNFKNPVLSAFSNAIWNCPSAARVTVVLNEAAIDAPPAEELAERIGLMEASASARRSREERIARYDLSKRPYTRALLKLAAELIDEGDKLTGPIGVDGPKTLEADIKQAVLLIATAIVGSAALGASPGLLTPGEPHNFLVATFAFIVLMSLENSLSEEGYDLKQDDIVKDWSVSVCKVLFVTLGQDEFLAVYQDGHKSLLR